MATKNSLSFIPLTSFDSASLTNDYQAINTGGLPNACNGIAITNDSDVNVTVSFDGTTDHNITSSNATRSIESTNGKINGIKKGTTVYLKGSAGTGMIYLSGVYYAD